ncbi:hypothetical protein KC19_4G083900 [Ceratodon purpureus]|uniref:PTM/DIR17-like Tudor domain-containing protein n=1 Tax=Ceratodon purpureus TaxID=3225 RepID=A0A8T0I9S1_CERPU|nr:hypothetical protein KC19_4G083900 [Ceratodon purpureus]
MGQTWSKFMPGHTEAGNSPPVPETEIGPSQDPSAPQSEASTEASSSVPLYQGGPFSVAGADVELSSLKDDESDEERDQERGKETQTTPTPTPSTSQHLSPLQAFLKGPEKAHLKKSQASPSTACNRVPQKVFHRKSRAFKQPRISPPPAVSCLNQHHAPKLVPEAAKRVRTQQESSTPSPSQFSPSQIPDEDALHLAEVDDDGETASQSLLPEPEDDVKIESATEGEELMQPLHSSSQKLLLFELDRKRKAPAGLPSLAVECMGASRMKLKARTSQEKSSEGGPRKTVVDLGGGEAAVGRRMKKVIGSRGISEGHVASYDVFSRLYQIEYDNGKEETMEWLELEPCLVEQSKTTSAPVEEMKGTPTLRKSQRNAPRTKKVEEFVYTKRQVRGRRRKK